MGSFHSKKTKAPKGPAITETDRAILSLKTQRKKLEDQEKLLTKRLAQHAEVAGQLAREGRRERALLVLRKKKLGEKQLAQVHGLIINLEEMLSNIETTKKQNAVFTALQTSTEALRQLQAQVKLEDVQHLLDDTAEARQYQRELGELLGGRLSEEDDLEVAAELAALEEVVVDEEQLEMPSAPTTKVPAVEKAAAEKVAAAAATEDEAAVAGEQPRREALLAS